MTTGNYPFPIHINQGVVFARDDMTVAHENSDTTIIQQVDSIRAASIGIVADNTYVWAYVTLCKMMTSMGL